MKKILVVEDELAYVKLLHDQLEAAGYDVIAAEDGEAGLKMALKEKPNLILLDIRMPKMDGMAMLNVLRKDKAGKNMKVIVLTNLEPDNKIISQIVATEPTSYCIKSDTRLDDLLEKIKEVTSS